MQDVDEAYYRVFRVEPDDARDRLDRFVERQIPGLSRGRIRGAINAGEITIDGSVRESGRRLREGQVVEIRMPAAPVEAMAPEPIPISIVYEDEGFLVVDKPAEMFAHPTYRVFSGTLLNAVAFHVNRDRTARERIRPLLVHRLDRATSGLIVVSKAARAHKALAALWMERRVEKRYVALLCGRMPAGEGIVDAPIGSTKERMPGYGVLEGGRAARTWYRVVDEPGPYSLVDLEPLTGRTNQLRIHADHVGAPVAGDDLHGLDNIARFRGAHPSIPYPGRLFLHAASLAFTHPTTRERLELGAPLPGELRAFLDAVGSSATDRGCRGSLPIRAEQ
jgi:23S rRNA pseudouridine1911/1915/1917 synthase